MRILSLNVNLFFISFENYAPTKETVHNGPFAQIPALATKAKILYTKKYLKSGGMVYY